MEDVQLGIALKDCVAGDLALVLPHRIVTNILEGLEKLDKIIPGVNNDETLLYGPEIKFFSNEIETNNKFKLENEGIYFIGDGAGKAGNIVVAAATGLVAARDILDNLKNNFMKIMWKLIDWLKKYKYLFANKINKCYNIVRSEQKGIFASNRI